MRLVQAPELAALLGMAAPWGAAALAFLPRESLGPALLVLLLCGALLLGAAAWSRLRAWRCGLDEDKWAALAVLTLGLSVLPLAAPRMQGMQMLCHDCGRLGDFREPFCYGCGG